MNEITLTPEQVQALRRFFTGRQQGLAAAFKSLGSTAPERDALSTIHAVCGGPAESGGEVEEENMQQEQEQTAATPEDVPAYQLQHTGGGKYQVVQTKDGEVLGSDLTKVQAEDLVEGLTSGQQGPQEPPAPAQDDSKTEAKGNLGDLGL